MNSQKTTYANVAAANLYAENSFTSAIVSQSTLWEKLSILKEEHSFYNVICEDGYQGWIHKAQTAIGAPYRTAEFRIISQPFVSFHRLPSDKSRLIRTAVGGSRIIVEKEENLWQQCIFPDGEIGWTKKDSFFTLTELSRGALINYAEQFLGVPYFWGGKTPLGFDCSGFVQFVHNIFHINLRRDAHMQFEDAEFISDNHTDGKAGDLCFFSENGNKITHVGFYLGDNRILHARGMVKINSLSKSDFDFDKSLLADFAAVKSFIPQEIGE